MGCFGKIILFHHMEARKKNNFDILWILFEISEPEWYFEVPKYML